MSIGTFTLAGHLKALAGNPATGAVLIESIPAQVIDSSGNVITSSPGLVPLYLGDLSTLLVSDSAAGPSATINYRVTFVLDGGLIDPDTVTFPASQIASTTTLASLIAGALRRYIGSATRTASVAISATGAVTGGPTGYLTQAITITVSAVRAISTVVNTPVPTSVRITATGAITSTAKSGDADRSLGVITTVAGVLGGGSTGAGTVLWEGSLGAIAVGTSYTLTASTLYLSAPWPYSSVQTAGNTSTNTASMRVDATRTRNSRESRCLKIVMQPGSQRCQPTTRGNPAPPFQGRWTPDNKGTVDLWFGWSMFYDTDWGSVATLVAENTGTYWHTPMAFRMDPTNIANGSMNQSGDDNDGNGSGGAGPLGSTPRTFYLRRNSVLDASGYYTDGFGLDKMPMGLVVTGAWMDFVVHVRWSTTATNALREIWRDGAYLGRKTTANAVLVHTSTGLSDSHTWRLGTYQETNITHTRTVWYDNCRIGTSYAAVDPASTT